MSKRMRSIFMWLLAIYIAVVIIIVLIMVISHYSFDSIVLSLGGALVGLLGILWNYWTVSDIKPKRKQTNSLPGQDQDHVTNN
jgi:hypothetical protein